MNIRDLDGGQRPALPPADAHSGLRGVRSAATGDRRDRHSAVGDRTGSSELTALLSRLESLPEVRETVVAAAKAAVANGELLARAAAEATASAFLDT